MTAHFQHPQAIVEASAIGEGTRIWAFAHVLPRAVIGNDCNICDHVFIENDVVVGDRVTVKCGVQLWDGIRVEDDVFIGPNATFANDRFPRSKRALPNYPETVVRKGASIGANATVLPGVVVGQYAMVGAGAVVTRNVPPYAVVVGNPARIARYVEESVAARGEARSPSSNTPGQAVVEGVQLVHAATVRDLRGNLSAREFGRGLPFEPQRVFAVFDVPTQEVRGEHAHKECAQLLVCLRGTVSVVCDDGRSRQQFDLDSPEVGVYVPPMVWATQYKYSADAVLLVYASHPYDAKDYIRNYDEFLAALRARRP